jgi:uncharacterized membrane-anchored protein YitT (DUF2179 family)
MDKREIWHVFRTWGLLAAGAALYAFGLQYFILPNFLMEGGVTGIAVLLNYSIGISVWLSTLAINIPIFVIGWRKLGNDSIVLSIGGTVLLSIFLWIFERSIEQSWIIPFKTEQDFMLVVLYAGLTLGTGLGLVFRAGGTTGGVDIVARILNRRFGWSMGQIILTFDAIILGTSLVFIPKEKVLYTIVVVFIASKLIDFIQEGAYAAKSFTIICREPRKLAGIITQQLDRGVTLLPAIGGYSNRSWEVVYCVVSRYEIRKLKSLVRQHDKRAFMVISDVHDVFGEGFRES